MIVIDDGNFAYIAADVKLTVLDRFSIKSQITKMNTEVTVRLRIIIIINIDFNHTLFYTWFKDKSSLYCIIVPIAEGSFILSSIINHSSHIHSSFSLNEDRN